MNPVENFDKWIDWRCEEIESDVVVDLSVGISISLNLMEVINLLW